METYALISCTAAKRDVSCEARLMYDRSALFRKAWRYCQMRGYRVLILSAKHGLLSPEATIEPYDVTLKNMRTLERRAWAKGVSESILRHVPRGSALEIHAGVSYTEFLDLTGYETVWPLGKLKIGERLRWYEQNSKKP